jgi:hypothetical protein
LTAAFLRVTLRLRISISGGATMSMFTHKMLELTNAAACGVARSLVECAF